MKIDLYFHTNHVRFLSNSFLLERYLLPFSAIKFKLEKNEIKSLRLFNLHLNIVNECEQKFLQIEKKITFWNRTEKMREFLCVNRRHFNVKRLTLWFFFLLLQYLCVLFLPKPRNQNIPRTVMRKLKQLKMK